MWIRVRSALHRLRWRTQKKLGRTQHLHSDDSHTDKLRQPRCSSLHEKNEHSTSSTPPSRRQTLLSLAQDKQACESSDGGRKDMELDPSADKEKEDQRDDKTTTKKRNQMVIASRITRPCRVVRRKGVYLPPRKSLPRSVLSNVAASRRPFLQTRKLKNGTSPTPPTMHLANPTIS